MNRNLTRFSVSLVATAAVLVAAVFCPAKAAPAFEFGAPPPPVITAPFQKLTFKIKKLTCPSCAATFVQALGLTGGIRYVKVDLHSPGDADAVVIHNPYIMNRQQILDLLHNFHLQESNVK